MAVPETFAPRGIYVIFATANFATRYPLGGPRSRAAPMCIRTPPLEISHTPKKQRPRNRPAPGYIGRTISVLSINTSADLIGADAPRTCAKATRLSRYSFRATSPDRKWALRTAQSATTSANAASKENPDASARPPLYLSLYFFLFTSAYGIVANVALPLRFSVCAMLLLVAFFLTVFRQSLSAFRRIRARFGQMRIPHSKETVSEDVAYALLGEV